MMRAAQTLLILGLWAIWPFATPASAEAVGESLPNAVVASWTEKDGLPSASVWSIAQTPDGYLWLSTGAGLVRFDGVRFVPWNESNHSLPPDGGGVLCVARDGSLWLGTKSSAGVTRIHG